MQFAEKNFFQLFSIPENFQIDQRLLAEHYRELQDRFHPDRVAGAAGNERLKAVQLTSLVNEAYDTLKSPLKRAGYLLKLNGVDVEQVTQEDLGSDLLMEQMLLRESLQDIGEDDAALDRLKALGEQVSARLAKRQESFSRCLDSGRLQDAKRWFHEMQFLHKLASEIEETEERLLDY
ncbi:MAG: Fe-S protein assembly co-chaperone HscB [Pseudohongiellaceae bacterium]